MSKVDRYDVDMFGEGFVRDADGAWVHIDDHLAEINHLKQLLRNVRTTLHFTPEDVLAIDAALREDEE